MEAGAIGQFGAAAPGPAEKVSRSGRGPATIPLLLTEGTSATVIGGKRETALSVSTYKNG